jgi:hypothetical protein
MKLKYNRLCELYKLTRLHDLARHVPLNGTKTIPEAIAAQQELKTKFRPNEFLPKPVG